MGLFDNVYRKIGEAIASRLISQEGLGAEIAKARNYRMGNQKPQMKVKDGQYNDNLIMNIISLAVDRGINQMTGGKEGVRFRAEGDEGGASPELEYIDRVWDANEREILMLLMALEAGEGGTGYIMLNDPRLGMSGIVDKDGVTVYPRLLLKDPVFMEMTTPPEDWQMVFRYTYSYKYVGVDGKDHLRRQIVEQDPETQRWVIDDEEMTQGGQWVNVGHLDWPYLFSPIVHWQNLPEIGTPYGKPDITWDIENSQDKFNGNISSLNKSLRLGTDPLRYSKGLDDTKELKAGPGQMPNLPSDPLSGIWQLPPATEWSGAMNFINFLKAMFFNLMRVVDIDNLKDKLGTLTNFGIKVLMTDNINKIDTKRLLLENALEEVNRRLLVMAGMQEVETEVIWSDFIPVNEMETAQYHQLLITMGVESKQTAAEKLGLDWEREKQRMEAEKQTAQANLPPALQQANASQPDMNAVAAEMMGGEQPPGQEQQAVEE